MLIMNSIDKNPNISEIQKYFNFYQTRVLPHVELCATQSPDGCHALHKHTASVVFRGIDYAMSLNKNPIPVIFASAFHDMARTHDAWDTAHGANAVDGAKKIMKFFSDILSTNDMEKIIYAIINHTTGTRAPDYVSACLWDADRTRLSWLYGYDAGFFNTERGKYVASHDWKNYIDFQKQCFPNLFWSHEC